MSDVNEYLEKKRQRKLNEINQRKRALEGVSHNEVMEAQAKSLGLKLIFVDFPEEVDDWMNAYVQGISRARDEYDIQVISTGDINLVGTMQRNWMERACEGAGIKCYLPLWDIDKEKILGFMLDEGFEIIFSCVKSPFFDESWINRPLDQTAIQDMKATINIGLTPEQIEGLKAGTDHYVEVSRKYMS